MTRKRTYVIYLESGQWRQLREAKFRIVGRICSHCSSTNLIRCHHIRYKNLTDCTTDDIMVICQPCHHELHRAAKHFGISLKDVEAVEASEILTEFSKVPGWVKKAVKIQRQEQRRLRRLGRPRRSKHQPMPVAA